MDVENTEITYHPFHNDPDDKVVIRSSDDIHFRASRHRLMRSSKSFEGILELPTADPATPIQLAYASSTISIFLDAINSSSFLVPILDVITAKSVVRFCRFVMADEVHASICKTIRSQFKDQPFALLIMASHVNDIDLARIALKQMSSAVIRLRFDVPNSSHAWTPHSKLQLQEYLQILSPSYQLALFHGLLMYGSGQHFTGLAEYSVFLDMDWSKLADTFDPSQYE